MRAGKILFIALGAICVLVRALTLPRRKTAARAAPGTVFFYEPYGMGDCVKLQPLARQWAEAGSRVIVAVKPQWAEIFAPHPKLTLIGVKPEYASQSAGRKWFAFFKDVGRIRSAVGDLARGAEGIDVRGDVRSILIMYLLGCGKVRTLPRYHTANDWPVFPFAARREKLLAGEKRRIVNTVFAPPGADTGMLPDFGHLLPADVAGRVCRRRVGLMPFASWEGRFWPVANWTELIGMLRADAYEPVVLTGPGEEAAPELRAVPVLQAANVRDWVANIAECAGLVSVNSGPMHIADALCKPLIVLEGATHLPLWGPENPNAAEVSHQHELKCAPCNQEIPAKICGAKCMALITPEEVMGKFRAVMETA